ncbi:MAG: hypothetical protein ACTSUY_10270 [Alphaproteobacteria bacterium]
MIATLKRLVVMVFAYASAGVAAAFTFMLAVDASLVNWQADAGLFPVSQIVGAMIGGYTVFFTAVPAVVLVLVGEMARIRAWYYYILGGGAAAAFAAFVQGFDVFLLNLALYGGVGLGVLAAGFVGGGVYWLIAGRRA